MLLLLALLGLLSLLLYLRIQALERGLVDLRTRLAALEREPPAVRAATAGPSFEAPTRPGPEPVVLRPPPPESAPPGVPPPLIEPASPLRTRVIRNSPQLRAPAETLENRIGSRWLLYIGVAALAIGVSYFEKLALDNHWIGETARVIQGGAFGALLVYVGLRFVRGGYALYGQIVVGGGFAILYFTIYAAFSFYQLLPPIVAFVLLVGVTVMTAAVADRQQSAGLALMAVAGGFITPFLLSRSLNNQLQLFTYDALLIAAIAYLAHRRDWPLLNLTGYVLTVWTVVIWLARHYDPSAYLITETFLTLFAAMYIYVLRETRRSDHWLAPYVRWILYTAPALHYLASLRLLAPHSPALLVYLTVLSLAGAVAGVRSWLRLTVAIAVMVPLMSWCVTHAGREWLIPGLVTIGAVFVIQLLAHLHSTLGADTNLDRWTIAEPHASGLSAFAAAYLLIDPVSTAATAPVAASFGVLHGALAIWLLRRRMEQALQFASVAFTLVMIAIALQFDGVAVTIGWAAEGAAVCWVGLRARREWLRTGGLMLLAISAVQLLAMQSAPSVLGQTILFNRRAACGGLIIALCYALAQAHRDDAVRCQWAAHIRTGLILLANLLTITLLTSEIVAFWSARGPTGGPTTRRELQDFGFARELMVSVTWAAYATALVAIGIYRRFAAIRYFAIVLFAVTIVKVFVNDLGSLDRVYRVASIIALGITLLVASYLYNRFRLQADAEP